MDPTFRGLATPTPSAVSNRRFSPSIIVIAVLVFGAIIAAIVLLMASGNNPSVKLEATLSARLVTLNKLVAVGKTDLTDPDLQKVNSDVSLVVAGDTTALEAGFKTAGLSKVDKAITAAEADDSTFTSLKDAKVNGRFDAAYKPVLGAKLESTNALVKELYNTTRSRSLKDALNTTYGHLQLLQNELAK